MMTASQGPHLHDVAELLAHDAWLRRLARRLVHGRDVDDLVQDTWSAALRARPDTSQPLRSWLAAVARRLAGRGRRGAVRRGERERRAATPEALPSTEATVALLELQHRVAAAVAAMAEPYRTAVLLRYYHGLDTEAIAARCACSHDVVRKRLERGLDELRQRLRADYGPEWRAAAPMVALARKQWTATGSLAAALTGTVLIMSKQKIVAAVAVIAAAGLFSLWATTSPGNAGPAGKQGATPNAAAATAALPAPNGAPSAAPLDRVAVPPPVAIEKTLCRGQVLDAKGRPLAGVPLVVTETLALTAEEAAPGATPLFRTAAETRPKQLDLGALPRVGDSDSDGRFAVGASGEHFLLAGPGYATLRTPSTTPGAEHLLVVAVPSVAVRGVVVDSAGQPLPAVRVTVYVPSLRDFPAVLDQTRDNSLPHTVTGDDGTFALGDLPSGLGEITFAHAGMVATTLPVPTANDDQLRVVLGSIEQEFMVVRGRVLDTAELAVAGATVGIHGRSTHTDQYGAFQLVFHKEADAPLSTSALFAAHPGHQTQVLANFGSRLEDPAQREVTIHLVGPALTIAGRVVDAKGRAQAGARVFLWNEPAMLGNSTAEEMAMPDDAPLQKVGPGIRVCSVTDGEGAFELRGLCDQPYRLRVWLASPQAVITSEPIAAGSRGVELRLPADLVHAAVAGKVVTADGTPVAGVWVLSSTTVYRTGACLFACNGQACRSGGDGSFELKDVPTAETQISVSGDGIMPGNFAVDLQRPLSEQRLVVARRCHFRVAVEASNKVRSFKVLDAANQELEIFRIGTDGTMSTREWFLEAGNSGVLSVSEKGVTLALNGKDGEVARLPLRLVPGEIVAVQY